MQLWSLDLRVLNACGWPRSAFVTRAVSPWQDPVGAQHAAPAANLPRPWRAATLGFRSAGPVS
jgi:hypothetical protein